MEVSIDSEKFFSRIERLYEEWNSHKASAWGGAEALCIPLGAAGTDLNYSKSSAFHIYFFGYEFPDSLLVIVRNNIYFMATAKKCSYFERDLNQLEKVEISNPLGLFFGVKDESELVMKHGFVQEMENIIDNDTTITHEALSTKIDEIILDPAKIGVKVSAEFTDSCYQPIIQSGGKYDIKVSATSNADNLSSDIIICSLGARYKGYCANITRTFMVDALPKDVLETAKTFLRKKDATMLSYLPKSL
eukprot:gene30082-39277_t